MSVDKYSPPVFRLKLLTTVSALAFWSLLSSPATAELRVNEQEKGAPPSMLDAGPPAPGQVLSAADTKVYGRWLPPSANWALGRGLPIEVVESRLIPLEPARLAATEKYSAQVQLSADGLALENYVAGLPFPSLSDDDPDLAVKLMFNYENRILVDDLDIRNFDCDTGSLRSDRGMRVERHFVLGHFRRLYHVGRLYHEPKPAWPTPDGIRYRESLHPIIEPFDLKGVGLSYNRYLDPGRQDDSWLYYPLLKRVRRLSTAQRSEALFGQDTDLDSYAGWAGSVAWMDWSLLGRKKLLAPMHTRHFPGRRATGTADFIFDDTWELRDLWIIEGRSRLPGYAYSRRIVYLDQQSFVIPYAEMYDHEEQLWKAWFNQWKIGPRPFPGAKTAVYAYEQQFLPAVTMFDMLLDHATYCTLPSREYPGEEGWYFNFGDAQGTSENVFSLSYIISTGR